MSIAGRDVTYSTTETGPRWAVARWLAPLDAVRGMAALAVVVHHASLQRLSIERHAVLRAGGNPVLPILFWMGSWGVTLFFVLSGFCIHLPQARREANAQPLPRWSSFYARRAWRLLPTHYASLAVAVAASLVVPSDLITKVSVPTLVAHIFMLHPWFSRTFFYSINAVFWSIAVEVHFYVTYPVLMKVRRRLGKWMLPALLIISMLTYGLGFLQRSQDTKFVLQNLFLVTWWQWGLGVVLADVYVRGRTSKLAYRLVSPPPAMLCWTACSLLVAWFDPTVRGIHLRPWIFPLLCSMVVMSAALKLESGIISRTLQRLGHFSYSIYLIHPVVLAITGRLIRTATLGATLSIACDVTASLLLSRAFFVVVERHFIGRTQAGLAIANAQPIVAP